MASTSGGQSGQISTISILIAAEPQLTRPEEEAPARQKPPDKQELVSMLAVRTQILKAAETKAAIGNLDDADTPEVIRVEAAFALRKFPELRNELGAQQALLKRLLEMDCAAKQRLKRDDEARVKAESESMPEPEPEPQPEPEPELDPIEMAGRRLRAHLRRRAAERRQAVIEPLENVASEQPEVQMTLEDRPQAETEPPERAVSGPLENVASQQSQLSYRETLDLILEGRTESSGDAATEPLEDEASEQHIRPRTTGEELEAMLARYPDNTADSSTPDLPGRDLQLRPAATIPALEAEIRRLRQDRSILQQRLREARAELAGERRRRDPGTAPEEPGTARRWRAGLTLEQALLLDFSDSSDSERE
jgi:hypothetical protein